MPSRRLQSLASSYRSRLLHWLRATPPWPQPTNSYADPLLFISNLLCPFGDGDEVMEELHQDESEVLDARWSSFATTMAILDSL